jgi:hypothetical protein
MAALNLTSSLDDYVLPLPNIECSKGDRIREQLQQMRIILIDRPNGETSIVHLDNKTHIRQKN